MKNKLKNETSPYLLQHADNPVNWYPWGEEAFDVAKRENKPIFLSIGYSTCHWCHVMAHESFEDEATAKFLNENFISIKVDREERPDIDSVYMSVCQAFTGSGGWPMSIFMTWDKKPFYAGTYFPIKAQYGMISFGDLLKAIIKLWREKPEEIWREANKIIDFLNEDNSTKIGTIADDDLVQEAFEWYRRSFDEKNGGFGRAPKFPTPHNLLFLMLYAKQREDDTALEMAEKTLLQMRMGGIFDHIGYGFSRYSTDAYFLVPHFEKMLYDNALLIIAYSALYSITKNDFYLDTAKKVATYVLKEMTSDEGGFYSAQDADSEGVEGKYYTFTKKEIYEVLGAEVAQSFTKTFDISDEGNFEGVSIPNLLKSKDLKTDFSKALQKLYAYRRKRYELHLDDKILTAWCSMMIGALAVLYRASGEQEYLEAAKAAQRFIEKYLQEDLSLFTSYRDGRRSKNGFIDDYAFYIGALIEIYNSTFDRSYLERAEKFCEEAINGFADTKNGGFHLSRKDQTELFMNPKETYDGAIPSGNSMMLYNFVRLYQITEKEIYREQIEKLLDFLRTDMQGRDAGHSMCLLAWMMYVEPPTHIVVVTKNEEKINPPFFANVICTKESKEYPFLNDKTTYYVCKGHMCLPPTNSI